MNFNIKSIARIYIAGVIFLKCPHTIFISTYVIIPRRIPLEMEYVSGIIMMHTKAGIDSEKSPKGIFLIGSSISRPTMTSAGAVAAAGMERNRGEKNSAITKQQATAKAVSPERPP